MDTNQTQPERFCPQCGKSRVPLAVPHISVECKDCGRTVHFVRPGDNGNGIKVEAGERLVIPEGFITLSLEPEPNSKLFRPGLAFLINQLFAGKPPTQDNIVEFIDGLERDFDKHVESLAQGAGVDLTSSEGVKELTEKLKQDNCSRDWYMFTCSMLCGGVKWSIENNATKRAAWAGYLLGTFRGLTIVSEPVFEQTLWRGYLANVVVYEAAAAAAQTPAEAEAVKALQPLFQRIDEATLHAWVESGLPLGPRIGVKNLPEELIKALAKFQLATIQRERQESRDAEKQRREAIDLRIKWFSIGVGGAASIVGILKAVGLF